MLTARLDELEMNAENLAGLREAAARLGTTALLGGATRFVFSTSGHIAAIVNPPGNRNAHYQVSEQNPADPREFMKAAQRVEGTWWTDYVGWLRDRCGPERPAP